MPLFRKAEPEPPQGGGKDVLRGALRNYNRNPAAIGRLNSELQVSTGVLQAFEAGADNLTIEQLSGLTRWFFFNAEYDAEADLLRAKSQRATPLGVYPPPSPINFPPGMAPREPGVFHYGPTGPAFSTKDAPPPRAAPTWPRKAVGRDLSHLGHCLISRR